MGEVERDDKPVRGRDQAKLSLLMQLSQSASSFIVGVCEFDPRPMDGGKRQNSLWALADLHRCSGHAERSL